MYLAAVFLAESLAAERGTITARDALAHYRQVFDSGLAGRAHCAPADGDEITVCARRDDGSARLPLPAARFGPGEVVAHASEAAPATNAFRGGPVEPSRLGDTLVKSYKALRSIFTGEDPDF